METLGIVGVLAIVVMVLFVWPVSPPLRPSPDRAEPARPGHALAGWLRTTLVALDAVLFGGLVLTGLSSTRNPATGDQLALGVF